MPASPALRFRLAGRWSQAVALSLLTTVAACASRQPDTRPGGGTLTVGVSADGPGVETLTLSLLVNGTPGEVRADGGLLTRRGLPPGDVSLRLEGLPASCAVEGGAARTVVIRANRTTALRLVVHCRPDRQSPRVNRTTAPLTVSAPIET